MRGKTKLAKNWPGQTDGCFKIQSPKMILLGA